MNPHAGELAPRAGAIASWVGLAGLFTFLNALKPLHLDDTAYFYYARHIAENPLDPYGFDVFWYSMPLPANWVLAPPLLPYWWAAAIRLFGQQPFLWKLWLFPFSLLFVASFHLLARRFARGLQMLLLWMTVLSPTFLPSFNLMLDVPALALSLTALAVFLRAVDRDAVGLAVMAGLLAGLALETKYTSLVLLAVLLLAGLLHDRLRLSNVALAVAVGLFVGCEGLLAARYGESHFLHHLRYPPPGSPPGMSRLLVRVYLLLPLLTTLGGVAPALGLLGLAALGARPWSVLLAGGSVALGFLLIAVVPEQFANPAPHSADFLPFFVHPESEWARPTLDVAIFGLLGLIVGVVLTVAAWKLGRHARQGRSRQRAADGFLILWLVCELAGYVALSPFPAARRVMGLVVVGTLLTGRLAARTCRTPPGAGLVRFAATCSILLGLGYYGIDLHEARTEQQAAQAAASHIAAEDSGARVWYVGRWGFQFYAEAAGMQPIIPGTSAIRRGDWLVLPDRRLAQQRIRLRPEQVEVMGELTWSDPLPFRSRMSYYAGPVPLEHHEGPRLRVRLDRAVRDFRAEAE